MPLRQKSENVAQPGPDLRSCSQQKCVLACHSTSYAKQSASECYQQILKRSVPQHATQTKIWEFCSADNDLRSCSHQKFAWASYSASFALQNASECCQVTSQKKCASACHPENNLECRSTDSDMRSCSQQKFASASHSASFAMQNASECCQTTSQKKCASACHLENTSECCSADSDLRSLIKGWRTTPPPNNGSIISTTQLIPNNKTIEATNNNKPTNPQQQHIESNKQQQDNWIHKQNMFLRMFVFNKATNQNLNIFIHSWWTP